MRILNNTTELRRILRQSSEQEVDVIFPLESLVIRDTTQVLCPHCGQILNKYLKDKKIHSISRCPYCRKNYKF